MSRPGVSPCVAGDVIPAWSEAKASVEQYRIIQVKVSKENLASVPTGYRRRRHDETASISNGKEFRRIDVPARRLGGDPDDGDGCFFVREGGRTIQIGKAR